MTRYIVRWMIVGLFAATIVSLATVLYNPTARADEANQDSMAAQMLAPSYKLYGGNVARCSATVISSQKTEDGYLTHFLTAAHCIANKMNIRKIVEDTESLDVLKETVFYAKKFRVFKKEDVAVLELLDTSEQFPVARIAKRDTSIRTGRDVWAVGYPRTLEITITSGEFTGRAKTPDGTIMNRATAPIHGGSSGGALFIKTSSGYEIAGVTSGHYRDTSFMNYFALLESIHKAIPKSVSEQAALPKDF